MSRAEALGTEWAHDVRASLGGENRRACGGWPGTLSEARVRLSCIASVGLSIPGRAIVSVPEFESMASALYASARNTWRRHALPEKSIDDAE
ncbi:MAG TPA: hypothetical protein VHM70_10310 [Polyangiaceae bacterium]|jgi:hypothetical protein|nr:hypothetical protein [Polyangiaceae bacterium]